MKRFDEILGQDNAISLLRGTLERERVPQSLLFHGPAGVGKATTAAALALALLCPKSAEGCGVCPSCRLVEAGNHPDLLVLRRLAKERPSRKGSADSELVKDITVDQIRHLTRLAGQTPRQSAHRVMLIDEAERMNASAQNALLKTLEEPAPRAVLILVASNALRLLPTVRSRCLSVRFVALRAAELRGLLESLGHSVDEATARAALAEGRPGLALELDVEALRVRREEILSALERLTGSTRYLHELPALAAELAGRDESDFTRSLDLLQSLLRDVARAATNPESPALTHLDLSPRLARLGQCLGGVRAATLVEAVDRARNGARFNLNRPLLAESVLAAVAGGPLP